MKFRHLIRPPAEADLTEASLWYEQQRGGLGEEFLQETARVIGRVLENPLTFPVVHRRQEVRRAIARRFPYSLFFSITDDVIVFHAVLHAKRRENAWKKRL